jgi:serine/threonine-protein kinase RsbW
LELSVTLPRETASVPVVRNLAAQALRTFGVRTHHIDDVRVAITEACANVIEHAGDIDTYEVRIEIETTRCVITVVDQGAGFPPALTEPVVTEPVVTEPVASLAESGRGLALMRALVDRLAFVDQPRAGAVVHMVKKLGYDGSHPLRGGGKMEA